MRAPLRVGSLYFGAVSLAHLLGWKVPGLFVYFNVPSQAYQDRIIGLLAFGWSVFLWAAAESLEDRLVRAALVSGAVAVLGLAVINATAELPRGPVGWFWLETAALGLVVMWLGVCHVRTRRARS